MLLTKKILLLVITLFSVYCQQNIIYATQVSDLIHTDGTVTETMVEILGHAGVRIKGMAAKETWPAMVAELNSKACEDVKELIQGKNPKYPNFSWRANPDQERWDMKLKESAINQELLINLILLHNFKGSTGLNMGAPTYPKHNSYSEFLLLGSTLGDFKARVGFLNTLFESNVTHDDSARVFILTGKRSFNDSEKQQLRNDNNPQAIVVLNSDSEKEGMEWVYTKFPKDSIFANLPFSTINDANPTGPRATTESTLTLFFKEVNLSPDSKILAVSTHIFALYQYLILKRVAYDNGFQGAIDICAPALIGSERDSYPNSKKLAMLLDNLSRIFYEICEYKKKTGEYPS